MEKAIEFSNFSFEYPDKFSLRDIDMTVARGELLLLYGKSGSGKSTLLRQLKPTIRPNGKVSGEVLVFGRDINELSRYDEASKIAIVMQNAKSQIVTDKVYHELAFGLESLGYSQGEIRRRVSEVAQFFGIEEWFYKNTNELSGGELQILNLASLMCTNPDILLLDEPTSQLDPLMADRLIDLVCRINKELGITVVIAEHRLSRLAHRCDRICLMDEGRVEFIGKIKECAKYLRDNMSSMFLGFPHSMQIWAGVENEYECPVTVGEGRAWLNKMQVSDIKIPDTDINTEPIIQLKNIYFKYDKNSADILKNLTLDIKKGEILSIMGGNGAGKSTLLGVISGINKPYHGKCTVDSSVSYLMQDVKNLFTKKTVYDELREISCDIDYIVPLLGLGDILGAHPYDISGGQMQKLALAKVLLLNRDILLLDEPTKGFDAEFKRELVNILKTLSKNGKTIVIVSHDTEFCAEVSDRCAMLFDGAIVSIDKTHSFFRNNTFYTTDANRIARDKIPDAITVDEVIKALGGKVNQKDTEFKIANYTPPKSKSVAGGILKTDMSVELDNKKDVKRLIPYFIISMLLCVITVFVGNRVLGDRKYYIISMLVILESMIPYFAGFEKKRLGARGITVTSSMTVIAGLSRVLFYFIPQVKPMAAVVIISGIALGPTSGFIVGAMGVFVSNFFFGQGPWTPWQMLAMGGIGLCSGLIFNSGLIKCKKHTISAVGAVLVFLIYGAVMNLSTVLMYNEVITKELIMSVYALGIPFDLIHAVGTFIFLWLISKPILEEFSRIQTKYGRLKL